VLYTLLLELYYYERSHSDSYQPKKSEGKGKMTLPLLASRLFNNFFIVMADRKYAHSLLLDETAAMDELESNAWNHLYIVSIWVTWL
jgi:hypothetical protein